MYKIPFTMRTRSFCCIDHVMSSLERFNFRSIKSNTIKSPGPDFSSHLLRCQLPPDVRNICKFRACATVFQPTISCESRKIVPVPCCPIDLEGDTLIMKRIIRRRRGQVESTNAHFLEHTSNSHAGARKCSCCQKQSGVRDMSESESSMST